MKISLDWLNEFLPISQAKQDVDCLIHELTMLGFEVESRELYRRDLSGVICVQIIKIEAHPNADKLRLVTVDRGDEGPQTLVCGAPNVREGMRVPYARLGAKLPGMEKALKKAKIRGIVSEGMLCSDVELGLSEDHSGLLELDDSWSPGECLDERLGLSDTILDIDITQNRGDAFSIVGIARELAAHRGVELQVPPADVPAASGDQTVGVQIEDSCARTGAPRYAGWILQNVKVGPSPRSLVDRLEAVGLRSINNVVDITNYVMWESGHPVHAFDLGEVRGSEINVRFAAADEEFVTLDGVTHKLHAEHVLICDAERPIALGGIMGGLNSGVTEKTTEVLLECACFDPVNIRMGARRVNLATDSARRFERGVDMENVHEVLGRLAHLMVTHCGAQIAGKVQDCLPHPRPRQEVRIRPERVRKLLGLELSAATMTRHLCSLGIAVTEDQGQLLATAPAWRFDLDREIDYVEEIVRLEGYDRVPDSLQAQIPLDQPANEMLNLRNRVRATMVRLGFRQQCSYSMVDPRLLDLFYPDQPRMVIRNPLAAEMSCLRNSLLPSLASTAVYNLNRRLQHVCLFEIDREFHPDSDSDTGCREEMHVCAVMAGKLRNADWLDGSREIHYHDLKASVLELLRELHVPEGQWQQLEEGPWSANSECFMVKDQELLRLGQLKPQMGSGLGSEEALYAFDLDLEVLAELDCSYVQYRAFSRQPSLNRDLSLLVEDRHSSAAVEAIFRRLGRKLLTDVRLFDIYQGEGVPEGWHSQSWTLRFTAMDRNLSDKDVDPILRKILAACEKDLGARLRA